MTAPHGHNPQDLAGLSVSDKDGHKVGTVQQVYLDDATGKPEWITVRTGLFGTKETFVPLSGARRSEGQLQVPYGREDIKEAPRIDADGHLEPSEEENLYRHYNMTPARSAGRREHAGGPGTRETAAGGAAGTAAAAGTAGAAGRAGGRPETAGAGGRARSRETAGTRGAPEMMRSEERAYIDTEQHETGHARLRKHVVTEDVRTTVPISHEEVHVTREPISPEDRSRSGNARIEESQVEVTLHEERPVVRKETVPVERVRLDTEKVTEQEEVTTRVRKEEIEYDDGSRERKGMTEGRGKHGREDRYS